MNKLKNQGFSLTEMALTLAIVGTLSTLTYNYYARAINDQKRINEGIQLNDFNKAIGNFLTTYQSAAVKYTKNGQVLTISPEKLQAYGYFRNPKIVNPSTGKQLYPCASIFFENNQLQSFVYFRTDDAKQSMYESKEVAKLMAGLKTLGGTAGVLLKNETTNEYNVKGLHDTWKLDNSAITKYFSNQPNDFLDGSTNQCKGAYLASQTYSIYTSTILNNLNGQLNDSQIIKQNMNEISTAGQENRIDTLNMDATGSVGTSNTAIAKNRLIFQSNPDCQMNPSILSTMQDYDPNYKGGDRLNCTSLTSPSIKCSGLNQANIFGCRNKQLSLGVENINMSNGTGGTKQIKAVVINGFNQVDTSGQLNSNTSYLAGLNADTIQPTATVEYGAECNMNEVGAMAKQKDEMAGNNNPTLVQKLHSLNQNLMICQKNLLCPNTTFIAAGPNGGSVDNKACWLPLTAIHADINFTQAQKLMGFTAPTGFYIDKVEYYDPDLSVWIGDYGNNTSYQLARAGDGRGGSKTEESICRWHANSGLWCDTAADGDILSLPANVPDSTRDQFMPYADSSIAPTEVSNGLTGIVDKVGVRSYDFDKYMTSCTGGNQNSPPCISQNTTQATYWMNHVAKQFEYKAGITLPVTLNPKFLVRQSRWRHGSSCGNVSDCDNWKFGKILSVPYYIKKITLTNDTNNMAIDLSNPPSTPRIVNPANVDCEVAKRSVGIPARIQSDAQARVLGTKAYPRVYTQPPYIYPPYSYGAESLVYVGGYNLSLSGGNMGNCTATGTGNYCPAPNTTGSCSNPRTLTTYEGEYSCIWLNGFGSIPGTWKCE